MQSGASVQPDHIETASLILGPRASPPARRIAIKGHLHLRFSTVFTLRRK